jgi:hypothetical protein
MLLTSSKAIKYYFFKTSYAITTITNFLNGELLKLSRSEIVIMKQREYASLKRT